MHGHSPDVTTTTVDVVAHAGYRIGDRVVRAAKVTVLDPEPETAQQPASAPASGGIGFGLPHQAFMNSVPCIGGRCIRANGAASACARAPVLAGSRRPAGRTDLPA